MRCNHPGARAAAADLRRSELRPRRKIERRACWQRSWSRHPLLVRIGGSGAQSRCAGDERALAALDEATPANPLRYAHAVSSRLRHAPKRRVFAGNRSDAKVHLVCIERQTTKAPERRDSVVIVGMNDLHPPLRTPIGGFRTHARQIEPRRIEIRYAALRIGRPFNLHVRILPQAGKQLTLHRETLRSLSGDARARLELRFVLRIALVFAVFAALAKPGSSDPGKGA